MSRSTRRFATVRTTPELHPSGSIHVRPSLLPGELDDVPPVETVRHFLSEYCPDAQRCRKLARGEFAQLSGQKSAPISRGAVHPLVQHAEQAALGDAPAAPAPLPLAGVLPRLLFLDNDELQGKPGVREQLRDTHQF